MERRGVSCQHGTYDRATERSDHHVNFSCLFSLLPPLLSLAKRSLITVSKCQPDQGEVIQTIPWKQRVERGGILNIVLEHAVMVTMGEDGEEMEQMLYHIT